MIYEYTIEMKWVNITDENKGTTDSFNIASQSINQLTMFNDYENTNMPVIYCTLTLDKKYIDKIIKGAKTASIYLNLYKVYTPSDINVEIKQLTQYSGKMNYFINQDINYNKELDYAGTNKDKKDVLQSFSIGLMFADCIEANKKTANTTLNKTTMMNAVYYFLQDLPLLIEPFEYNDSIDQLIVPPMDSLSKTIDYFNNIKVFYSTPYRFYIDPDCAYLISTSGNGVQRKDEKYGVCMFDIRAIDDRSSYNEGMNENSIIGAYYTDIHVKDSYYTIDSDTNKLFNEIATIIDPSIQNSKALLGTINSAIGVVNNLVNDITGSIKKNTDKIKKIPNDLTVYRTQIREASANIDGVLNLSNGLKAAIQEGLYGVLTKNGKEYKSTSSANQRFEDAINYADYLKELYIFTKIETESTGEDGSTSTSVSVHRGEKIVDDKKVEEYKNKLRDYKAKANNANKSAALQLPSAFTKAQDLMVNLSSNYANFTSFFNGITSNSISNNLSGISKKIIDNNAKVATNMAMVNQMREKINTCLAMVGYVQAAIQIVKEMEDLYDYWSTGTALDVDTFAKKHRKDITKPDENGEISNIFSPIKIDMMAAHDVMDEETSNMSNSLVGYEKYSSQIKTMVNSLEPMVKNLKSYCVTSYKDIATSAIADYKKTISNAISAWNSLSDLGKTAKKQLNEMTKSAKEAENKIKSMDFSINSLKDIQSNISNFKDLSNIGLLGIDQFKANLNISSLKSIATGTKIIRMKNDNANAVKNIKANIENHINQLSITKTGLDTTVFTPNKKYIVKNYNAHKGTNGIFILNKKSDIFIRHTNDKFTISTQLELSKVNEKNKITV